MTKAKQGAGENSDAELRATIERLSSDNARLTQQLGTSRPSYASGQLTVGLRNISNYNVGLIDKTTGTPVEIALEPERDGEVNPRTRAVVSYAFWMQLRKGKQVGHGLVIRDDSVLGPADNVAPPDRPEDIHPEAERNQVLDPREWMLSRDEDDTRASIAAMTSEPSLRRLQFAVDEEIWDIGARKYSGDPDRPKKATKDLPAVFRLVDELATERLDELNPTSAYRHLEMTTPERASRT